MKRYLVALICFLITTLPAFSDEEDLQDLIPSTPDQIATLSSEQDLLIGGVISPLSGQPALKRTDLIVKGAQSIFLYRIYIPPHMPCSFPAKNKHQHGNWATYYLYLHLKDNYKGWRIFPHLKLLQKQNSKIVSLTEPNGMTLEYYVIDGKTHLASPLYAISNFSGSSPNGKYDPRNTQIILHGTKLTMYSSDGTIRFYSTKHSLLYLLDKEILPNGKVLKYHYENGRLALVESMDPKERYVYASLGVHGSPLTNQICHFAASNGQTTDYTYQRRPVYIKVKEKRKKGKDKIEFTDLFPPILSAVSSPFFRHETLTYAEPPLLENYSGKNETFLCGYRGFGAGVPHFRVHELFFPVGHQDGLHSLYNISYDPPIPGRTNGSTTVKNGDGTTTIYYYSKAVLPIAIHFFGQDGAIKKEKTFTWKENHWLESIEVKDGQKKLLFKKRYDYDRFGNPILEEFTGDLTGMGQLETYMTKRVFSEDGRHLLLREETEDGKIVSFTYLSQTNLVTSKLTSDKEKIILREFSDYDDCNNLIQTIVDDGKSVDQRDLTGVTERKITRYQLRQQPPFLHMIESVEEKYLEDGQEKLFKRTHLEYDPYGNVKQEEIYDSDGRHVYTLFKEYNERGTLVSETNAIGQKKICCDDARGRVTSATNFSNRIAKTLRYDAQGRLREQTEKGDDALAHSTFFNYDLHDRLIQKIDPFENNTQYAYDLLVNKVTRTDFPSISSPTGEPASVTTHAIYDALGNEISKTDANGHTTLYRYNAYGSPTEITRPDGSKELFRYEKNSMLATHTDPDGLTIAYTHDVLGRVLSKTYHFQDEIIALEKFTYSGFHLLTETDKEGYVTTYTYDGAGRKIQEERCDRVVEFHYNALGQLTTVRKQNQNNTLLVHYHRDLIDRVLEETKTDAVGTPLYKINYTYDPDGKIRTITRNINGKEAIETWTYDSFERLTEHQDALGFVNRTIYDENHQNPIGQKVLKIAQIDPQGTTTMKTYDALSRLVGKEILNPHGKTISALEKIYDPVGNLTSHREHIYKNDQFQNAQTIQYTYTSTNQINNFTRACGTKDARTTTYTYYLSGKVATKTLPDGIVLSYAYHPLGFLSRLDSSDDAIQHCFKRNLLGHLLTATDEKQHFSIKRKVDPFGNVIHEEFPCGLTVKKNYDAFDRPTLVKIDNVGEIVYNYDPLFLKSVVRCTDNGEALYSHYYDEHDLNGNLIAESLIGNSGQLTYTRDLNNQRTAIISPYFSQMCSYDANGNLLRSILDSIEHRYSYDHLFQLTSENSILYAFDSAYNRTQKNALLHETNDLNELSDHSYDQNGNQSLKKTSSDTFLLVHDPLNRLIEATSNEKKIHFVYDPLGRRLNKTVIAKDRKIEDENYLYDGHNEIGAFVSNNTLKNLRILGVPKHKQNPATIAVELEGKLFAPILDVQGNIRRLVDVQSRSIATHYNFTAFGEELNTDLPANLINPWRFASKRFDAELGLIYFGKRYYDPENGRWLETDPAGFVDGINLYQYVFNNPFRYVDPDGQFIQFAIPLLIWGAEIVLPSLSSMILPILYTASTAVIWYAGYKAYEGLNSGDNYSATDDYAAYVKRFNEEFEEEVKEKNRDTRLPQNPDQLLEDSEWKETTHPKAKEHGHRTFENTKTGEKLRYDAAKPGETGHKGDSHWHRFNPDSTSKFNKFLDANGDPVPEHSEPSHLYPD